LQGFSRINVQSHMPTIIKAADLIESIAGALQYISYYHPAD